MLNKKQAAERIGVSTKTIERLVQSGQLTVYRVSTRCHRFKDSDIETFMQRALVHGINTRRTPAKTATISQ